MFNMVSTTLARFERCISGMVAWGKASNSYANRKEHWCVKLFRIIGQLNDLDDCRFQSFGSGSGLDLDSIRIQEGKNDPQKF
jgi:hypothetical protein